MIEIRVAMTRTAPITNKIYFILLLVKFINKSNEGGVTLKHFPSKVQLFLHNGSCGSVYPKSNCINQTIKESMSNGYFIIFCPTSHFFRVRNV